MRAVPLIRAAGVLPFARFLDAAGAGVETHWHRAGLSPLALVEPERLLPWNLAIRFVEEAAGTGDRRPRASRRRALERARARDVRRRDRGGAPPRARAFGVMRDRVGSHDSAASYWGS